MRKLKLNVDRMEMDREQVQDKWSGHKGVSLAFNKKAENVSTEKSLLKAIQLSVNGKVCEVGCGPGRMAQFFKHNKYVGVDINSTAIAKARQKNPNHIFKTIGWDEPYPDADTYLFFTVMIHIPDDELVKVFEKLKGRVIIGECMFRGIRDFANGMNFQRDPGDYKEIIEEMGGKVLDVYHLRYSHFPYFINVLVADI